MAGVGNNFLVGNPGVLSRAGGALLYDGSTGQILSSFLNPTPAVGDRFGESVAAVGNNVLVERASMT